MPVRMVITNGTAADCAQAPKLIEGLNAAYLLADKAYDANHIISQRENSRSYSCDSSEEKSQSATYL